MTTKAPKAQKKDGATAIKKAETVTRRLADRLGLGIDAGIFNSVVALRAQGFNTTASCEGHLQWGEPAPWIEIGVITSANLPKNTSPLLKVNLLTQQRMIELLDSFYSTHLTTREGVRIIIIPRGIFGGFRLTNQAARIQAILPAASKREKLSQFQEEFQSFAQFLTQSMLAATA